MPVSDRRIFRGSNVFRSLVHQKLPEMFESVWKLLGDFDMNGDQVKPHERDT
jgi:hypothetical protein